MSLTAEESLRRDAAAWVGNFVAVTPGWKQPHPGNPCAVGPNKSRLEFYLRTGDTLDVFCWRAETRLGRKAIGEDGFSTPSEALTWMEEMHASPMGDDE